MPGLPLGASWCLSQGGRTVEPQESMGPSGPWGGFQIDGVRSTLIFSSPSKGASRRPFTLTVSGLSLPRSLLGPRP